MDQSRTIDVPQVAPPSEEEQQQAEWWQGEDGTWYLRIHVEPGVQLYSPHPAVAEDGTVFTRRADLTEEQWAAMLARYPAWSEADDYAIGDLRRYDGSLYRCVQAHTAQSDWHPDVVPALWTVTHPPEITPRWVQPTGAQDAYDIGDRVIHATVEGVAWLWESKIDANTTEPDRDGDFHRWWEPIRAV